MEMSRLTRDGTAEPVSRDQILSHERGQGNIYFPCSTDHEQDWEPYTVDPYSCYMCDRAYIHHTNTEDTGSVGYSSVCYITSRIGWVSMKRIYRYRCKRDPGKLYNNFCYMYSTKDQPPTIVI